MMEDMDRIDQVIPPPKWEGLEKLSQPVLPVLAEFVHGCSKDPATRTASVTQFVTSLCQLTGRSMTAQMPSTIVINAHDLVPDATDLMASLMVANPNGSGPRVHKEGYFQGTPEQAPGAMAAAIKEKQGLKVNAYNASIHRDLEERYFAAQRTGFGYGPSRRYAEAWHDTFGLITDRKDEVILRIDRPQDRAAFRKDVLGGAKRLRQPLGYGKGLELVSKHIALSGSFPASLWDTQLASGIVGLGLPLLMLPSVAKTSPEIANKAIFDFVTAVLPGAFSQRVEEPNNLIPDPWFEGYGRELRLRLRHMHGDYEHAMQKLVRQLFPVCLRIAEWCGKYSGSNPKERMALTFDMCAHATRGLVLSVAGLAWHGLGIDAGCPPEKVAPVLEYLRTREVITRSELLSGTRLDKNERNRMVECLAAEDLIRIDGKIITATSYAEFVESLHRRKALPEPINHWAAVASRKPSAT
jgi:hypothetical protein